MKVYAIYEGNIFEKADVRGNILYHHLEEATSIVYGRVDILQKEYDHICNQGYCPEGRRWKENIDPGKFVIKSWDNGINEIYIVEYNVR